MNLLGAINVVWKAPQVSIPIESPTVPFPFGRAVPPPPFQTPPGACLSRRPVAAKPAGLRRADGPPALGFLTRFRVHGRGAPRRRSEPDRKLHVFPRQDGAGPPGFPPSAVPGVSSLWSIRWSEMRRPARKSAMRSTVCFPFSVKPRLGIFRFSLGRSVPYQVKFHNRNKLLQGPLNDRILRQFPNMLPVLMDRGG